MKKTVLISLAAVTIVGWVFSIAYAECPEGKSEVLMVTPSGNEKVMCLPDAAILGIENAADHSSGTLSTATCPCWDGVEGVRSYLEGTSLWYCNANSAELVIIGETEDGYHRAVETKHSPYNNGDTSPLFCVTYNPTKDIYIEGLSDEEATACRFDLETIITEENLAPCGEE